MKEEHSDIHVFFASDKNYIQHTCVALASLLINLPKESVLHVYIMTNENLVNDKNTTDKITSLSTLHDFTLHMLVADLKVFNEAPALRGNKNTYARLLIQSMAPELDKALYLDSDLVAERDITALWNTQMENKMFAAVPENQKLSFIIQAKNRLGLAPKNSYFNAGVMLLNLKKMRSERLLERVCEYMRNNADKIVFHDQDILNAVCKGDFISLPRHWNFMPDPQNYNDIEYRQSLIEEPAVIHYAGYLIAPWLFCSKAFCRERYYHYLKSTPFKDFRPAKDLRGIILYLLPHRSIPFFYRVAKYSGMRMLYDKLKQLFK